MSDLEPFSTEPERPDVQIDSPINIRPQLEALGIEEIERGICQDSYENRAILRRHKMGWDPVYASNGVPTGLIQARSDEMAKARRILSLTEKKPILVDPDRINSDYITGLDLMAESAADYLVPPWVIGATRNWIKEQNEGGLPAGSRKKPAAMPTRCRHVKEDGIRCMLWSSGRAKDDGYCRVHLGSVQRKPGEDIERARARLVQAAPYAVDVLEDLMENAISEPVKLKASTEILDRAGVRGGVEVDANLNVTDSRSAADIVADRLARLSRSAIDVAARLVDAGVQETQGTESDTNDNEDNQSKELPSAEDSTRE
jgi:hypothetical protein